jgi:hypothetical protein
MKDLQGIAAEVSWLQLLLLFLLLPLVQLFSPKSVPPLCCRKSQGICPERCDFLSSVSRLRTAMTTNKDRRNKQTESKNFSWPIRRCLHNGTSIANCEQLQKTRSKSKVQGTAHHISK